MPSASICPKCQFAFGEFGVPDLCPRCGFAAKRALKATGAPASGSIFTRPTLVKSIDPFARPRRTFPFIPLFTLALAFGGYQTFRHFRRPPLVRRGEHYGDPCFGKDKCVVLYITPWCPACEESLPVVQEMDRRWNDVSKKSTRGIRVMVGVDEPAKCRQKADAIGPFASVDSGGEFQHTHGVSSYPTWIVFDRNGTELNRVSGSFVNPDQADLIAEQKFGI